MEINNIAMNNLMNALDNEENESIINLTTKKIGELNLQILQELHLQKQKRLPLFREAVCKQQQ